MKEEKECKRWDGCNASLCPLYGGDVWYPLEDEICKSREHGNVDWVRKQRMINRKTIDSYSYYTIRMLQRNCVVSRGIMGLNPDISLDAVEGEENKWLKKHPEKKIISAEKREELSMRMKKMREMRKADKQGNTPEEK